MSDITERLRWKWADHGHGYNSEYTADLMEAADEIERLRGLLRDVDDTLRRCNDGDISGDSALEEIATCLGDAFDSRKGTTGQPTVNCETCHKTFAGPGFCCERDGCPHAANRRWPRPTSDKSTQPPVAYCSYEDCGKPLKLDADGHCVWCGYFNYTADKSPAK